MLATYSVHLHAYAFMSKLNTVNELKQKKRTGPTSVDQLSKQKF